MYYNPTNTKKLISLITLVTFIFTSISYAAPSYRKSLRNPILSSNEEFREEFKQRVLGIKDGKGIGDQRMWKALDLLIKEQDLVWTLVAALIETQNQKILEDGYISREELARALNNEVETVDLKVKKLKSWGIIKDRQEKREYEFTNIEQLLYLYKVKKYFETSPDRLLTVQFTFSKDVDDFKRLPSGPQTTLKGFPRGEPFGYIVNPKLSEKGLDRLWDEIGTEARKEEIYSAKAWNKHKATLNHLTLIPIRDKAASKGVFRETKALLTEIPGDFSKDDAEIKRRIAGVVSRGDARLASNQTLDNKEDRGKGSPLELLKLLIRLRDIGITTVTRRQLIEEYGNEFSSTTISLKIDSLSLLGIIEKDLDSISLAEEYKDIILSEVVLLNKSAKEIIIGGLDRWTLDDPTGKKAIDKIKEALKTTRWEIKLSHLLMLKDEGITRIIVSYPKEGIKALDISTLIRDFHEGEVSVYMREGRLVHVRTEDGIGRVVGDIKKESMVIPYGDPRSEQVEFSGGKGAQLAKKRRELGPVSPPGFNITTEANKAILLHNPGLVELIKAVRTIDVTEPRERNESAKKIQEYIMNQTDIPDELYGLIEESVIKLSEYLGYTGDEVASLAYRGSGIIEDFTGEIPWFSKSIGAQPGQGTTSLNQKGLDKIRPATLEVLAGVFNPQIFTYRDIQLFFDFVSQLKDEAEYKELINLCRKYNHDAVADLLEQENSPGYVHLRRALEDIAERESDAERDWLVKLEKSADEILNPFNLLTGISVLEQIDSVRSGTAFTAGMTTGFDGSTWARKKGEFPTSAESDFKGYTRFIDINLGPGMGPGIVEAMFVPDMIEAFLPNKNGEWVILNYESGSNEIALVSLDKAFQAISHKYSEIQVRELAGLYLELKEADTKSQTEKRLTEDFNLSRELTEIWIIAMGDLWYYYGSPSQHECPPEKKENLLNTLGLNDNEFFTLTYLIRHINKINTDYPYLSYIPTPDAITNDKLVSDEALNVLFKMLEEVANIEGKDKARKEGKFDDRRDIEFALSLCEKDDPNPYKVEMETYDLVTGGPTGKKWFKWSHLQNRPINPKRESSDPLNIVFNEKKVDRTYIEVNNIKPIAIDGLTSFGVVEGQIYVVDPYKPLDEQEREVIKLGQDGEQVIVSLQIMGPEHDNIIAAAHRYGGGAIVWTGNNTSHAYIFSIEQLIPILINPQVKDEDRHHFEHGSDILVSARDGDVWPGDKDIPLLEDNLMIRNDLIPPTKAGIIATDMGAARKIARLGTKSLLSRIEFFINKWIKIYPQAGEAYDNLMRAGKISDIDITDIDNLGSLKDFLESKGQATMGLSSEDIEDLKILLDHPEVIEEIHDIIIGYPSAGEFMTEKMRYVSNSLGAIFPIENKLRAYDNKEKEALLYGLKGASLYLNYDDKDPRYDSPLVGFRGSALMTHPHFKKGFLHLNRGILRSMKDGFTNNSFFFVFVRTPEEVEIQLSDFEKMCEEEGVFPKKIGVMIETPINVWEIDEINVRLNEFKSRHSEVKSVFVSLGTNDFTKTIAKISREDKLFTGHVQIMDPALIDVSLENGRIQIDEGGMSYGPKERGQPYVIKNDDEAAPVILRAAEHVVSRAKKAGVETSLCGQLIFNTLEMGRFDVASKFIGMLDSFGTQTQKYVEAAMLDYDTEVSKRVIREGLSEEIEPIAELSRVAQKGVVTGEIIYIDKPEDIRKIREGENKDKIVVMREGLGTKEDLIGQGIEWDYLRYARSILIAQGAEEGLELFEEDKELGRRIKARIRMDNVIQEYAIVTIDYNSGTVYSGSVPTDTIEAELQEIALPSKEPHPVIKEVVEENAGDVAKAIGIHPLAFIGYEDGSEPVDELLKRKIGRDHLKGKDSLEYLEDMFYKSMVDAAEANPGRIVVHNTFNLTRNELRKLQGGQEIESKKGGLEGENFDDRDYRLYGGARNVSDFWKIHRAELEAYKRAKEEYPNLRLQLTTMGVRSREILDAQLRVLIDVGIDVEKEELGLKLTTQADILYIEGWTDGEGNYIKGYIDQGISFFSYDEKVLAAAILAANLSHPDIFVNPPKDVVIKRALEKPLLYVHSAIEKAKDEGVWLAVKGPDNAPLQVKSRQVFRSLGAAVLEGDYASSFLRVLKTRTDKVDVASKDGNLLKAQALLKGAIVTAEQRIESFDTTASAPGDTEFKASIQSLIDEARGDMTRLTRQINLADSYQEFVSRAKIDLNTYERDEDKMEHVFVFMARSVFADMEGFWDIYDKFSNDHRIVIIANDTLRDRLEDQGITGDIVDIFSPEDLEFDGNIDGIDSIIGQASDMEKTLIEDIMDFQAQRLDVINRVDRRLSRQILSAL